MAIFRWFGLTTSDRAGLGVGASHQVYLPVLTVSSVVTTDEDSSASVSALFCTHFVEHFFESIILFQMLTCKSTPILLTETGMRDYD